MENHFDLYHSISTLVGAGSGGDGCPSLAARAVYGPTGPNLDQIDQGFAIARSAMNSENVSPTPSS